MALAMARPLTVQRSRCRLFTPIPRCYGRLAAFGSGIDARGLWTLSSPAGGEQWGCVDAEQSKLYMELGMRSEHERLNTLEPTLGGSFRSTPA